MDNALRANPRVSTDYFKCRLPQSTDIRAGHAKLIQISSVCSPRDGACRGGGPGYAKLRRLSSVRYSPKEGCDTTSIISSAIACGSSNRSSRGRTAAAGTRSCMIAAHSGVCRRLRAVRILGSIRLPIPRAYAWYHNEDRKRDLVAQGPHRALSKSGANAQTHK